MRIKVNRNDLFKILRFLSNAKKGTFVPDARVTFSGNSIIFEYCGITSEISGNGNNFGTVIIDGAKFRDIHEVLPETESIEIGVKDGRIYFGTLRFTIKDEFIQPSSKIRLPVNASKLEILRLIYHYSIEEIKISGWMPLFRRYEDEKENRIYAVYEKLSDYGISIGDIATIVNKAIQEKN